MPRKRKAPEPEPIQETISEAEAQELVRVEETPPAVFDTSNPALVIEKAQNIARMLVPIIESQKLYKPIGGRKFVYVDGWTTMLAMLGVFPHVVWSRRIPHETACIYESRVVLRTMAGNAVAAGEALCSSMEENWHDSDEYAIRSMSQTRAVGKAARLGFSWILKLAGYEGTPAEEMESVKTHRYATKDEERGAPAPPEPEPEPQRYEKRPPRARATPPAVQEGLRQGGEQAPGPWIPPSEWFAYIDHLIPIAKENGLKVDPGKAVEWLTMPEHRNWKNWMQMTERLEGAIPKEQLPKRPPCIVSEAIEDLDR